MKLNIRNDEIDVAQKAKYRYVQIGNTFEWKNTSRQFPQSVQVGNTLDWKEHSKTVSSKVSRAIGFLETFLQENLFTSLCTIRNERELRVIVPLLQMILTIQQ